MRALGACAAVIFGSFGCTGQIDGTADPTSTDDVALAQRPIRVLRGVDRASVLSVGEARLLEHSYGVRWTGVYIGGACNGGSGWTRGAVTAIAHATGWQFMPIWVGQQSPAICGASNLSYGRGHADGVATAQRMHAMGWLAHRDIPVALDVEARTYFDSPGGSTQYVRGWVNAVRAAGYRAYVYGSPFGLNHFHDAHVRIDAAWAASFFYNGFRNVTPGELDQMGNRYRARNRAWQYAGDFFVSGAGRIDADTSNLLLAPAPGGTNRGKTAHAVPASCGALQPGEGLARGESLASCDGSAVLALSSDGELTLTSNGAPVWTAGTAGAGDAAVLRDTGELVVEDAGGEPVFASGSSGFPDAHVELRGADLAVVGDDDGLAVWSARDGMLIADDPRPELDDAVRE